MEYGYRKAYPGVSGKEFIAKQINQGLSVIGFALGLDFRQKRTEEVV